MKRRIFLLLALGAVGCLALFGGQPQGGNGQGLAARLDHELAQMRGEMAAYGWTFKIGPNAAMQYRLEDLCGTFSEFAPEAPAGCGAIPESAAAVTLPASYVGWTSTIKDQGQCGSCWAFGTIGNLEAVALKKAGAPQASVGSSGSINVSGSSPDLSEEQVLSCNPWGWSCNGGNIAYNMLMPTNSGSGYFPGAMPENCFPYVAAVKNCAYCSNPAWTPVSAWGYVGGSNKVPSVSAIKTAIYTYGSVSAGIYADRYFQAYTGGVFNDTRKYRGINHEIVLVGWDDSKQAWLLKNSWGKSWGIGGFMWIKYSTCNVGYGAAWVRD